MSSPDVTVVIPVFNGEAWVADAISSALAQRTSCEIIVVDDGSTDETARVVESFRDEIVLVRQRNRGVSAARNAGVGRANGESAEPESGFFTGGTLGFFGLMDDPRMADREFGLTGQAGLLVAFRPEIVHRIAPVTDGERFTIVTWFEG